MIKVKWHSIAVAFLFLLPISLGSAWWWWEYRYPIDEFQRLGGIQFPEAPRVVKWEHDGWGLKGRFQIGPDKIDPFVSANKLDKDPGGDFLVAERCLNKGDNQIRIQLERKSGRLEMELQGPDHSGHKPCSPD